MDATKTTLRALRLLRLIVVTRFLAVKTRGEAQTLVDIKRAPVGAVPA